MNRLNDILNRLGAGYVLDIFFPNLGYLGNQLKEEGEKLESLGYIGRREFMAAFGISAAAILAACNGGKKNGGGNTGLVNPHPNVFDSVSNDKTFAAIVDGDVLSYAKNYFNELKIANAGNTNSPAYQLYNKAVSAVEDILVELANYEKVSGLGIGHDTIEARIEVTDPSKMAGITDSNNDGNNDYFGHAAIDAGVAAELSDYASKIVSKSEADDQIGYFLTSIGIVPSKDVLVNLPGTGYAAVNYHIELSSGQVVDVVIDTNSNPSGSLVKIEQFYKNVGNSPAHKLLVFSDQAGTKSAIPEAIDITRWNIDKELY